MDILEAITAACVLAYEEDANQVVGLKNREWCVMAYEDPESDTLGSRIEVNADGPLPEFIGTIVDEDWRLL